MKPTIVHFILDVGRGGAETMLVSVLKELKEYRNILVTLTDRNDFKDELIYDKYICLNIRPSLKTIPIASLKFRRILKDFKVDLVHSHLPLPNFIARVGTPYNIPLVTTIHTYISKYYTKRSLKIVDKITYRLRTSTIIGCSEGVLNDYFKTLHLKRRNAKLIYNPVNVELFHPKNDFELKGKFKLVCTASLKSLKNISFLIDSLAHASDKGIELHIFGDGYLRSDLEEEAKEKRSPVKFHGIVKNIHKVLHEYDLFVLPSLWEGFSISVLEAMSARLPMLLSDIPSFREQAENAALYFGLSDQKDFIDKVIYLMKNEEKRIELAYLGYRRVYENFNMKKHIESLRMLYQSRLFKKNDD